MPNLAFHPLADIFPLLDGQDFAALVADIQQHGVREAIWLYQGQLLDGRNRYRACQQLQVECPARLYEGDDATGFVVSMNLRRRHLDESQRGMVANRLATLERGVNQHTKILVPTQQQAAELLNVSDVTVQKARKVQREAAPEVIKAVDAGQLTVTAALPLITLPRAEQPFALAEAKREAADKKPTATTTRAVVNRTQVVATVKEQLAAGKTPREAVNHALQAHEVTLPTPALADAIAAATDRQVTLPATDGLLHDGRTKEEEARRAAQTKRLFQLFNALEALATLPDIEALIEEIPDYSTHRVDQHLEAALAALTHFATLWKERAYDFA